MRGQIYESVEWILTDCISYRDEIHFDNETYASVTMKLRIVRKAGIYESCIKYPLVFMIIFSLVIYWLPPKSIGSRLFISFSNVIMGFLLIIWINMKIGYPESSSSPPVLLSYLSLLIFMNSLSIILSVIIYYVASKLYHSALPMRLASAVNGPLGKLLLLEFTGLTYDLKTELEKREDGTGPLCIVLQEEWVLLAVFFDRLVFITYFITILSTYPTFT